jgi:hypothetical protein
MPVFFAVSVRDNEVGQCPPDGLLSRPPEDARGSIVPIIDDAVGSHNNYRIKSGFQDQAQPDAVWRQAGKVRFRIANV